MDQEKEKKAFLAGYINASGPANDAEYKIALEDAESAWVDYWHLSSENQEEPTELIPRGFGSGTPNVRNR